MPVLCRRGYLPCHRCSAFRAPDLITGGSPLMGYPVAAARADALSAHTVTLAAHPAAAAAAPEASSGSRAPCSRACSVSSWHRHRLASYWSFGRSCPPQSVDPLEYGINPCCQLSYLSGQGSEGGRGLLPLAVGRFRSSMSSATSWPLVLSLSFILTSSHIMRQHLYFQHS